MADSQHRLREEMSELDIMLSNAIHQVAGRAKYRSVALIHQLSKDRRAGDKDAGTELFNLIVGLDADELRVVIRAFTLLLDMANLAEDRHRVRTLNAREQAAYPRPRSESIEAALRKLKVAGKSADEIQELLDQLRIELVFTAHPTEAKRRSIRAKLRRVRNLLYEMDNPLPPSEAKRNRDLIQAEILKLWLTDFIRPWRPTVLQEVKRGLSLKPVLWDVVPNIVRDFQQALARVYPGHEFSIGPCISFGSWIGGDRDGHPYVTSDVTEQTVIWLRQAALDLHLRACSELFDSLSISKQQFEFPSSLEQRIETAQMRWDALQDVLHEIPPNEIGRRWLAVIQWRIKQTADVKLDRPVVDGAYATAAELEADVLVLRDAVTDELFSNFLTDEIDVWLTRIRVFGFHLTRLDIRQDSRQYDTVIKELLQHAGVTDHAETLSETERQRLLVETLDRPLEFSLDRLSEQAREVLSLFNLLRKIVRAFGLQALGAHVISMTHAPSDVLSVFWLWKQAHRAGRRGTMDVPALPIVPLFETIDDLRRGPEIFGNLLGIECYREYLRRQQNRQTIMLGYSDSTKDGGYLSACWSLYRAQQELDELATREGITLTFFHGRGGSLGRGGGPAARSILSLPRSTFHGSMRLTEQGEVLAERYDDPRIAHRHLEQLLWSSLIASGLPAAEIPTAWTTVMEQMAETSFQAYRTLVEKPGFVEFFRQATPITEIEQLPIASRPSRRRGGNSLSDLRAIPWVFSWTQSRVLIPAWFGLGTAMDSLLQAEDSAALLRDMYRDWPFFRATINNAELALAKTDLDIARRYAGLAERTPNKAEIEQTIAAEFEMAQRAILSVSDNKQLLDGIPWLQDSIRVRNRYIDPLSLIQIELLGAHQSLMQSGAETDDEELLQLIRLSIKGIAAGMRTSG